MAKEKALYTQAESDNLGWDGELMDQWPLVEIFDKVLESGDRQQMIHWHRYLRDPRGSEERKMLARLIDRLVETCPGAG